MDALLPSLEHHPCTVSLPVFEGPLDLLLHLVEQARLDVTAVSLVQVTAQYLEYMRAGERIDHRALADFVAIGARLIWLKSRALLPAPPLPPADPDEDEPEDLVEMLREYQRFKEAALLLREREEAGVRAYARLAPPPDVPPLPGLGQVTLDRLAAMVQKALARGLPAPAPAPLARLRHSVRERMALMELAVRIEGRVSFARLLHGAHSREEIITLFFALLELIKQRALVAIQETAFGDIEIVAVTSRADGGEQNTSERRADGNEPHELSEVELAPVE